MNMGTGARSPSPRRRSALLLRCRSGVSSFTRGSSSPKATPLSSSLSNSHPVALQRSHSASKITPSQQVFDDDAEADPSKENRRCLSAPDPKPRPPPPSAWALSPGRSPPRGAEHDSNVGNKAKGRIPAWARSPTRTYAITSQNQAHREPVAASGGKRGGDGGGVLGLFRKRKEAAPADEEWHQLRLLSSRLAQWRFANAKAEEAMEVSRRNADEKLFDVWLGVYELRNLVAAKRILVQRRKQKMKLFQILQPQALLLSHWKPHAKKHIEAVAILVRLLGTACLSLPLVEGTQADLVSVHLNMSTSMEIMKEIAGAAGIFYSEAGEVDAILIELVKIIRSEIESLEELIKICRRVTSLEMHELSLRAQMIQVIKEEDERIFVYPQRRAEICKDTFTSVRPVPYRTLVWTIY
ncbi:QWRF motif-containing protein 7-like [Zingiber officinale]|uniref:QWRF motif-containing protein 7-like n=1 Tax=Zingiber officinale TaxID=94328 RepID=UPI001C4ADEA9|nr:QWRF motif-containing protein 7-like [Zingiber officinale]